MRLQSGTQLGPYEIQSLLGAGGMGEVYRARDTRLNRSVAIKILPQEACTDPQRLSRFESEARSASALNHHNIITIYDIGKHDGSPFIAMELVEGKTLRQILSEGKLPIKTILNIAAQLASGIASAHQAGIVHRDLKPENVIINKDGVAKILDFGLAKLLQNAASGPDQSQIATMGTGTASGVILGTIGYMSPEQASGGTADFRSDQFSLATIFYELASGDSPFQRKTAAETLTAIIREEPESLHSLNPDLPERFIQVTHRCLSKQPEARYASTSDLARDLEDVKEHWITTSSIKKTQTVPSSTGRGFRSPRMVGAAVLILFVLGVLYWQFKIRQTTSTPEGLGEASIAVLPFTILGANVEQEYFSDGMTEALITELAKIPGMRVIASNSVFQYKSRNSDIPQIAKELSVQYVVQGSVQRSGDRLRISAQLVQGSTGVHLWGERYDRSANDLFAVQDDISTSIASALKLKLTQTSGKRQLRPTENLQAYDYFLRGKYSLNARGEQDLNQAISLLERATELDPEFALAHATLGKAYRQKYFFVEPDEKWEQKAFVEIETAISLDSNLAEAYAARGRLIWTRKNNYPNEKAAADFKKAIALDPNFADGYIFLSGIYLHVGLMQEALQELATGLKLDPISSLGRSNKVLALFFDQQVEAARVAAEQSPGDESWRVLTMSYLGQTQQAETLIRNLLDNKSATGVIWDESFEHSCYAVLLAKTGRKTDAEQQIGLAIARDRGLGHFHHTEYNIGVAYALIGKDSLAIDWLRKTADHGFACYPLFSKDPNLQSLHGNPAFQELLIKIQKQLEYYRSQFIGPYSQ